MIYEQEDQNIYCYIKNSKNKSGKEQVFSVAIPCRHDLRDTYTNYSFRIMRHYRDEMWVIGSVVSFAKNLASQYRKNGGHYNRFRCYRSDDE